MKIRKVSNCYLAAKRWQRKHGGYLVKRPTRHKYRWPVKFWHYLWLPEKCPLLGRGCPYLISYVPRWENEPGFPPPLFNGMIRRGDDQH